MGQIRLPVVLLFSFVALFVAPAAGTTYYSQGSLNPALVSSWNSIRAGSGTSPADFTADDVFVIQNGHTMNPLAAWTLVSTNSQVQVESGGILNILSADVTTGRLIISSGGTVILQSGRILTVNNGNASGHDIQVSGTFDNRSSSGTPAAGVVYGTGASGEIMSEGRYQHNLNGNNIPSFTWNNGSTCEITGVTSTRPNNIAQAYHHFTWNCASQSANIVLAGGFTTSITGDLTIQNTNSHSLVRVNGSSNTLSISGSLVIASGTTFDMTSGAGSPTIDLAGNLTVNGTLTKTGSGTATFNFTGSGSRTFSRSGTVSGTINFAVSNGATLNLGTAVLGGSGTFTLSSGGGLVIGDANGITSSGASGNIQVSGTRSYSIGANYSYSGSSSQVFGDGFPTRVNDLTIGNGNTNMALNGTLTVNGTLTLSSGRLAIGSNTLVLNGNFSGSASDCLKANGSSSSFSIAGSGNIGTIYFDQSTPGTTNRILDLTYNRSGQTITLGNALEVTGTITPTAGTLATGGSLTLVSNSSGTARIITGSGSYISGDVTIQRYIPSSARRFRFLASTVTNATLEDWRGEIFITGNNLPLSNQSNTVGGLNWGFDATQSNNPTVYWYDETITTGNQDNGWTAMKNSSSSLSDQHLITGKGYRVYVRGDRSNTQRLDGTDNTQNAVTLDLRGPVNTGSISLPVSFTSSGTASNDGWNLAGNPYPAPFSWDAFHDAGRSLAGGNYSGTNYTSINPTAYIFNAFTNSYDSYNALSDVSAGFGFTAGIIPGGTAFFVQASGPVPAMTFTESYKSTATPGALFKAGPANTLSVTLTADSFSSDHMAIKYMPGATRLKDDYDIAKLSNPELNISSYGNDSVLLAANVRPLPAGPEMIPLRLAVTSGKSYSLRFSGTGSFTPALPCFLKDLYMNRLIPVSEDLEYRFIAGTDATGSRDRFLLFMGDSAVVTGITVTAPVHQHFSLYPNPAAHILYINAREDIQADVSISDLSGKQLMRFLRVQLGKAQDHAFDISVLDPGIYLLTIRGGDSTHTFRFARQ